MTNRLRKHAKTLQVLATCDKHLRKSIIKGAKPDLISCISDICYNTLQGKVKLNPKEKRKISKYKNKLRKIANPATTLQSRRELIQRGGGFLQLLLRPLLTVIAPLVKSLFGANG